MLILMWENPKEYFRNSDIANHNKKLEQTIENIILHLTYMNI